MIIGLTANKQEYTRFLERYLKEFMLVYRIDKLRKEIDLKPVEDGVSKCKKLTTKCYDLCKRLDQVEDLSKDQGLVNNFKSFIEADVKEFIRDSYVASVSENICNNLIVYVGSTFKAEVASRETRLWTFGCFNDLYGMPKFVIQQ